MFDYRRIVLLLVVLLVPGGVLALPALIADLQRRGMRKSKVATPASHPAPPLAA
jgi:hypothetical protein